jgi:hypothetical protein
MKQRSVEFVIHADGNLRIVWEDTVGDLLRGMGGVPQRASRIEVVPDGPQRGRFHVDFSLLARVLQDDRWCMCLPRTWTSYAEANAAEIAFLHKHLIQGEPL